MDQREINQDIWVHSGEDRVAEYARHAVRPVEALLLERHAAALTGRVLEIGVGAGRLTERLLTVADELTGIDVSEAMVSHCRRAYPQARFQTLDLRDLSAFGDAAFDALLAGYNVLDVLGHEQRALALAGWHRVLSAGGLLIVSSHNLHHADRIPSPARIRSRHPVLLARNIRRRRLRIANRERLAPLERHGDGWAVLNDEAHDFALLHYYATRDETAAQLAAAGFELVECVDLDGRAVGPGERAAGSAELHYVARRATS